MPTCSDQNGWNQAHQLQSMRLLQWQQYQQYVSMWEQANYPTQFPGTSTGNCTVEQASQFAWYACWDACGRAATQDEVTYWAGRLYDGVLTAQQVSDAWLGCPECYTRFGCS